MSYAKWKAVEIDRCLKNGIVPTPGPPGGEEQGADAGFDPGDPLSGQQVAQVMAVMLKHLVDW